MSAFDKLVNAVSKYGDTCIKEGAFVDQPPHYIFYHERRKQEFTEVLDAIGAYRDELLKGSKRSKEVSYGK